ncbi:hypothetical protein, partial [Endozoicomonas sp. ONNA2]|uniref:hypothetical protein n=1 Tax=Endozoicomonas sp. ONNA2 TaxID=2828741 RepID=UPI002148E9A4
RNVEVISGQLPNMAGAKISLKKQKEIIEDKNSVLHAESGAICRAKAEFPGTQPATLKPGPLVLLRAAGGGERAAAFSPTA